MQRSHTAWLPFRVIILPLVVFCLLPQNALAATEYLKTHAPRLIAKTEGAYGELIKKAALLHGADPELILAVIVVESEGNPRALSRRGAEGLMQLMPKTARAMGATNSKEPFQNILAGTKYLKELEEKYGFIEGTEDALVAYNMGPTRAKRWLSRADAEQYPYVANVMYVYEILQARERAEESERNVAGYEVRKLAEEFAGVYRSLPQPIMTRPRSLSMATLPMNLPGGRRNEVQFEN